MSPFYNGFLNEDHPKNQNFHRFTPNSVIPILLIFSEK